MEKKDADCPVQRVGDEHTQRNGTLLMVSAGVKDGQVFTAVAWLMLCLGDAMAMFQGC